MVKGTYSPAFHLPADALNMYTSSKNPYIALGLLLPALFGPFFDVAQTINVGLIYYGIFEEDENYR
jgi:hypothetical protein